MLYASGLSAELSLAGQVLCEDMRYRREKMDKKNKNLKDVKSADSGTKVKERTVQIPDGGYTGIEDRFVDQFLRREGETVEDAKRRLNAGYKSVKG